MTWASSLISSANKARGCALLLAAGGLAACDSTFFGEADPDFSNPFTEGEVQPLEADALSQVRAIAASQRHPGLLYALEDQTQLPRLEAFDEDGGSQGALRINNALRTQWRDLALRNDGLLLLDTGLRPARILRLAEPEAPPPYDAELAVNGELRFSLDEGAVGDCTGLGAVRDPDAPLWLLCGQRFYRLAGDFDAAGTVVATSADRLQLRLEIGEIRDFSISPGGDFGLLTGSQRALVVQEGNLSQAQWGRRFSERPDVIAWEDSGFAAPQSGHFAFNGVVVYLAAPAQPQGQLFTIFTP